MLENGFKSGPLTNTLLKVLFAGFLTSLV